MPKSLATFKGNMQAGAARLEEKNGLIKPQRIEVTK